MPPEAQKYLYDLQHAAERILIFVADRDFVTYQSDELLRSAVERQLSIVCEAVSQLAKLDVRVAEQLTEYRRIIVFRNILIHGYADIDDALVWDVVSTRLTVLQRDVETLLQRQDAS